MGEFQLNSASALCGLIGDPRVVVFGRQPNDTKTFRSEYKVVPKTVREKLYEAIPLLKEVRATFSPPQENFHLRVDKSVLAFGEHRTTEQYSLKLATGNVLQHLTEWLFQHLEKPEYSACRNVGPASFHEAINGLRINLAKSFVLDTSAGDLKGNKSEYFDLVPSDDGEPYTVLLKDGDLCGPIVGSVADCILRAKAGMPPGLHVNFFPKDEVLPLKEVDGVMVAKPPRGICGGQLASIIIFKIYFMPLLAVLGTDPLGSGHFVGLDPTKSFGDMHTHLTGHGSDVAWFAMDFSGYDNSISVHLIDAAINVLIALTRQLTGYTDEDRRVMRTICYDLCNPIYNMNGLYFQIAGSNASGNPLTTVLNCMVNHVAWNQMWLMWNWDRTNPNMVGEYHKLTETYATYYDNVRMVVMGDDFLAGS